MWPPNFRLTGWVYSLIITGLTSPPGHLGGEHTPRDKPLSIYYLQSVLPHLQRAGWCEVSHFRPLKAWVGSSFTVWGDLILPAPVFACGVTLGRPLSSIFSSVKLRQPQSPGVTSGKYSSMGQYWPPPVEAPSSREAGFFQWVNE